ncbi:sensor histidine kinase [Burkholderia gladioli]|uniref:sensor histidine kinase n=1 Tax=Burkholderia gladioli TaxID=28095 RepID=UPI00163EB6D2|nr:HAMP domain-containing sensor histidine kinase [Burkholderia gladioli]
MPVLPNTFALRPLVMLGFWLRVVRRKRLNDEHRAGGEAPARSGDVPEHAWHFTTFRWLSIYAGMFAFSMLALAELVGGTVAHRLDDVSDSSLHWERMYFHSIQDEKLPEAIADRIARDAPEQNYYGLFAADGRRLAGNISEWPGSLPADGEKRTFTQGLRIDKHPGAPVVRASAERRADGSTFVIARNMTQLRSIRRAMLDALIGGGSAYLLGTFALGAGLSYRQWRRFLSMRQSTLEIARGNLARRLPTGGNDEFDMLAHLVNRMLDQIENLMGEVKGACDGIAHDLRTPLAHMRIRLASVVANQGELGAGIDARERVLVREALADVDMLLQRFHAILRMSEIGARRRDGFGTVDLARLVRSVAELYEPLAEDRGIGWRTAIDDVMPLHGDSDLLFEAVGNLLDNAVKYSPPGGAVRIALRAGTAGPILSISDDGPGIPVHEREKVLNRFYRGERTCHIPGTGLGLCLVAAILELHELSLRIEEGPGGIGTVMRIGRRA